MDLEKKILQHSFCSIGKNILIQIGHFKYTVGIGPIEIKTFEDGIIFGENMKKFHQKHVTYKLIIDDIGVSSNVRDQLRDDFKFPKVYKDILEKYNLSESNVEVILESYMRNRASELLRSKSIHKIPGAELITKEMISFDQACEYGRCTPQSDHAKTQIQDKFVYSVIDPESGIPLILKEGYTPAKCNMIVAMSYYHKSENYDSIVSFHNGIWEQRMYYGAMVAKILFHINKPIIDIYYYDCGNDQKFVLHNSEDFKRIFSRAKVELVKSILTSSISSDLKDDYINQIEKLNCIEELKNKQNQILPIL